MRRWAARRGSPFSTPPRSSTANSSRACSAKQCSARRWSSSSPRRPTSPGGTACASCSSLSRPTCSYSSEAEPAAAILPPPCSTSSSPLPPPAPSRRQCATCRRFSKPRTGLPPTRPKSSPPGTDPSCAWPRADRQASRRGRRTRGAGFAAAGGGAAAAHEPRGRQGVSAGAAAVAG